MLIKYTCMGMGLNCRFVAKGETMEDVMRQAMEHVREKHAAEFNLIDSPEQIEKMRKALERSTRVVVS